MAACRTLSYVFSESLTPCDVTRSGLRRGAQRGMRDAQVETQNVKRPVPWTIKRHAAVFLSKILQNIKQDGDVLGSQQQTSPNAKDRERNHSKRKATSNLRLEPHSRSSRPPKQNQTPSQRHFLAAWVCLPRRPKEQPPTEVRCLGFSCPGLSLARASGPQGGSRAGLPRSLQGSARRNANEATHGACCKQCAAPGKGGCAMRLQLLTCQTCGVLDSNIPNRTA